MATKSNLVSAKRVETESLTGTVVGKRFTVVLDDISLSDEWDPAVLPVLQTDGIGKVSITDGVTEFVFRDSSSSTILFSAKAGLLVVAKFFVADKQEATEYDSTPKSV